MKSNFSIGSVYFAISSKCTAGAFLPLAKPDLLIGHVTRLMHLD